MLYLHDIILLSLPVKLHLSLLISHCVHEKILVSLKEMIWITAFQHHLKLNQKYKS